MKKKILIVDDETDFAEMIQMRLEANGFEVVTAPNGREGCRLAEEQKPGLILLDVMMPEMNGFEVLHKLRGNAATNGIPVIMLTAKGESRSIVRAQETGATDYLIKPCDSNELLAMVRKHVRSSPF